MFEISAAISIHNLDLALLVQALDMGLRIIGGASALLAIAPNNAERLGIDFVVYRTLYALALGRAKHAANCAACQRANSTRRPQKPGGDHD